MGQSSQYFTQSDTNNDGRMSPFEFKDWVLSIYYAVDVDMLDETSFMDYFNNFDTDDSGFLDSTEFDLLLEETGLNDLNNEYGAIWHEQEDDRGIYIIRLKFELILQGVLD